MIDEEKIRNEVYSKPVTLDIDGGWYTPNGILRKDPVYFVEISNEFLGLSKKLKANTVDELQQKAKKQLEAWAEREIKARIANAKEEISAERDAQVEELNDEVAQLAADVESLLASTLSVDAFVDINDLKRPEEALREKIHLLESPTPDYPEYSAPEKVKGWFRRRKRQREAEEAAQAAYHSRLRDWQSRVRALLERRGEEPLDPTEAEAARIQLLDDKKKQLQVDVIEYNERLDQLAGNLAYGVPEAVADYFGIVLGRSDYPDALDVCHECGFEPTTAELTLKVLITPPEKLDPAREYKARKGSGEIVRTELTKKAQKDRYESIVHQVALRSLHEVFEADRQALVRSIGLTVGSAAVDLATGNRATHVFVAVSVSRDAFLDINLAAVVPAATLKHLGAAVSKDPYGLVQVDSRGVRRS